MGASLALAGSERLFGAAGALDRARAVRAAARGDRAGQAAVLCHHDDAWAARRSACWSKPTWAGRRRSRATRTIRPAWVAPARWSPGLGARLVRSRPLADGHVPGARAHLGRGGRGDPPGHDNGARQKRSGTGDPQRDGRLANARRPARQAARRIARGPLVHARRARTTGPAAAPPRRPLAEPWCRATTSRRPTSWCRSMPTS